MTIIANKKYGKALIKCIANTTISLANLQMSGETVRAARITEVYWTGPWTVKRGANTVLQLTDGQDNWIFDGDAALAQDDTASLVFENGTPAGTIIVEVNKITEDEQ